jgi:phospholipase C
MRAPAMAALAAACLCACTSGGTSAAVTEPTTTPSGAPILLGNPTTNPPLSAGTRPDPGKPEGTDLLPEIEHVVVLMMENHSFDNYFGMLGRGEGFTLDANGQPTNANPDKNGAVVLAYHLTATEQTANHVTQNWVSSHKQFNDGKMDGFAATSGKEGMGYWTGKDLPFYYSLASVFPICDRYFGSVLAQTLPNRRFLHAATAMGLVTTTVNFADPAPAGGTIFDKLHQFNIAWFEYSAGQPEIGTFPPVYLAYMDQVKTIPDFLADAKAGALPFFSLVTPHGNVSEENPQDIQQGEAFSAGIIQAVMASPNWPKTVMILTYDEHGGYYDHVPPPPAFAPDAIPPDPAKTYGVPGGYDRLGFRVPTVVIAPFAKANYLSHVVHDHTSILRLIETKWNLGALTVRDANASNLLDALDFVNPPAFLVPPQLHDSARPANAIQTPPADQP